MISLPPGWPPLLTYDWWSNIGIGILGVVAAVLTAAATLFVAVRSHLLAKRVAAHAEEQADQDRDDRYRERLGSVIETAIESLVGYGNSIAPMSARKPPEVQMHAATQARLMLVHATARGEDKRVTKAVYEEFYELMHKPRWRLRRNVAGLLAGALANALARQDSIDDIEAAVRDFIRQEEDIAPVD